MNKKLVHGGCLFWIVGNNSVLLNSLIENLYHFKVPTEITTEDGKKYKIIGLRRSGIYGDHCASIISFEEPTVFDTIPISFFSICKSKFFLPPNIKRVKGAVSYDIRKDKAPPHIVWNKSNKFVSVTNNKSIINLHPLELIYQNTHKKILRIRETVRIIGISSYVWNESLVCVHIPPSVELIDDFAFQVCHNLKKVTFHPKSRLKRIGKKAFCTTCIHVIELPKSVEELGICALTSSVLYYALWDEDTRLRMIDYACFQKTSLRYIFIPPEVREIKDNTFKQCTNLSVVRFSTNSKLKKIGDYAFKMTNINSIHFPRTLEVFGKGCFEDCKILFHVIMPPRSNKLIIDPTAFKGSPVDGHIV